MYFSTSDHSIGRTTLNEVNTMLLARRTLATASAAAVSLLAWMAAPHPSRSEPLPPQGLDDATIVAIFDDANTADIESGELAAKKGQSKDVRDLGAQFARDHRAVRQQGRDLAKKLGVTPTPPKDDQSAKQHADAMASLNAASGAAFDLAFVRHEVAYHQSVIDAITKTLLPAIKNAELKALVVKVVPAFHGHLAAAQALERKLSAK